MFVEIYFKDFFYKFIFIMFFFLKVIVVILRILKFVVILMYEGMIYSIGEDLSVELVVFLLVLLVIIYMELLEVFIFRNNFNIYFVCY